MSRSQIRWVRAGAFRRWAQDGEKIPRQQNLLPADYVIGGTNLGRIIVSHAWLSDAHPDPSGAQLRELVAELDRLGIADEHLIFYDFCGLPQWDKAHPDFREHGFKLRPPHPAARTVEEDRFFRIALAEMQRLYTMGFAWVLVLPNVPEGSQNPRPYVARGWCFFELGISSDAGRILNLDSPQVRTSLESICAPMRRSEFVHQFAKTHFTNRGDDETVRKLYADLAHERIRDSCFLSVSGVLLVLGVGFLIVFFGAYGGGHPAFTSLIVNLGKAILILSFLWAAPTLAMYWLAPLHAGVPISFCARS